jgi:diguanylate cyclase (GGDEF)-like protein
MRLGIAARLAWVLALVGALAAGLTGYYVYQASRDLMVTSAKTKLLNSTHDLKRRITLTREMVSRNLLLLSSHPAAAAVLSGPNPQAAERQLMTLFRGVMASNPGYVQIRLIGARDHGLEVVRLDRDVSGLLPVTGDDLQEKGHFSYVVETLKLPAGQTYISNMIINHEQGVHIGEGQPSVMMAMPVMDAYGAVQGVIVINLDLAGMLVQLQADLPSNFQMYMTNAEGDFLMHPNPAMAFAFDRGQRELVQDHMPPTLPLVQGTEQEVVFEQPAGEHAEVPLVAAFITQDIAVASEGHRLLLGLAQPLTDVLADVVQLKGRIVNIVLVLGLVALGMAVVLARALARPINAIGLAARYFTDGQVFTALPTERQDEIGDLARSFSRMQDQIGHQLEELHASRRELSDLARHDGLTGLANRRLFDERLQSALAQCRRHGGQVALLFLDLDRFKDINDQHGHEAGDEVLKTVAERLRANTREVDMPARMGGDEFVVLVGPTAHLVQLDVLATKLILAVSEPMAWNGRTLQVGCSIGISCTPQDGDTPDQLMAAADAAMYRVKQSGRNGWQLASPDA